jgi:hypothetical protein
LAEFICGPDCLAERAGFELIVQVGSLSGANSQKVGERTGRCACCRMPLPDLPLHRARTTSSEMHEWREKRLLTSVRMVVHLLQRLREFLPHSVELFFGQRALCPSVYLLSGVKRRLNAARSLRSLSPAIGFARTKAAPVKEEAARGSTYQTRPSCAATVFASTKPLSIAFNPVHAWRRSKLDSVEVLG